MDMSCLISKVPISSFSESSVSLSSDSCYLEKSVRVLMNSACSLGHTISIFHQGNNFCFILQIICAACSPPVSWTSRTLIVASKILMKKWIHFAYPTIFFICIIIITKWKCINLRQDFSSNFFRMMYKGETGRRLASLFIIDKVGNVHPKLHRVTLWVSELFGIVINIVKNPLPCQKHK